MPSQWSVLRVLTNFQNNHYPAEQGRKVEAHLLWILIHARTTGCTHWGCIQLYTCIPKALHPTFNSKTRGSSAKGKAKLNY